MEDIDMLAEIQKIRDSINRSSGSRDRLLDYINYWLDHLKELQEKIISQEKENTYVV